MADVPSGDRPVNHTNGAVDGQHEHRRRFVRPTDPEQAVANAEQTLADVDQTSADRDQLAADRDQAASDRDLAHGVDPRAHELSRDLRECSARQRDQAAEARLETADERDEGAHARDLAALARDRAAAARDLVIAQRDQVLEQELGTPAPMGPNIQRSADQRKRAAHHRAEAAEHRALAAEDRHAALNDREQAARDRLKALVDREALARQLVLALTGVRTRAAGLAELDQELDRCRRNDGVLVVAYVDVVGLKAVNDSAGHRAGDALLKRVVALIRSHLRSYDLIIRVGGDEFLCAMSKMTLDGARDRFAMVGRALTASPDGGAIRTGLAALGAKESATELIDRADAELLASRGWAGGRVKVE